MPRNDTETLTESMADEYDFSQGTRGAVLPHRGKTRITIWIDTDILNWFRAKAEREGEGYQTALNAALRQYTEREGGAFPDIFRELMREELRAFFGEHPFPLDTNPFMLATNSSLSSPSRGVGGDRVISGTPLKGKRSRR